MHAWEQIQLTVDYIEKHLGEALSIESLARMAALSPFYYQRLFSRLVKKPVAEYIRLRRMAVATKLLADKRKRVLDVALETGFSSHEQFTRAFKAAFGMTPQAYRKEPCALNRMNKPELLLRYTLMDEGVPLVTDGIVLEIERRTVDTPIRFIGLEETLPVSFINGLGTESGPDPLDTLWRTVHKEKATTLGLHADAEEIGVTHPCADKDHFTYFAGGRAEAAETPDNCVRWELPAGKYVVCAFEAENFEALVMDALYKAEQYLYGVWLPGHGLTTEPFCAERYQSHSPDTTSMEVWLKIVE